MNNIPRISVAIPAYKDKYLGEAIDSILNQTETDFELIIVNDASPNPITEVVNKYNDPRIRYYINEQNIGGQDPVGNWNKCLSYARGQFFVLLCDDDLMEPLFLETMLSLSAYKPECNVFKSGVRVIDKDGNVLNCPPDSPTWESCEQYIKKISTRERRQSISEWLFRKDHIVACGGYEAVPMAWGADYLSIIKFAVQGGIAASTEKLITFRRSGINISNTKIPYAHKKLIGTKVYVEKLVDLIENNFPNEKTELLKAASRIKTWEQEGVMGDIPASNLWDLRKNLKEYDMSVFFFSKVLLKSIVKKIIRYKK